MLLAGRWGNVEQNPSGDYEYACSAAASAGLELRQAEAGLTLTDGTLELRADFMHLLPRIKQGALQRELLVKAARLKGMADPVAIDATAGLGEDSFLLAAAGFRVRLYECNSVIAALLRDALDRATSDPVLAPIAARMEAIQGDSLQALAEAASAATPSDLVYLDPMFPGRTKSAAVKKKFQLLHHLEQPCADECAMLDAALKANPHKIVIKRPIKGLHLAGVKPSYCITGKAVRYDVLVPPRKEA